MVAFNKDLIRKIVRMLESDHDGERAAAAGKLSSMAKNGGKNVDEMLALVYGGERRAQREAPQPKPAKQQKRPSYYSDSDFGCDFGGNPYDFGFGGHGFDKDLFAEVKRRMAEAARRAQQQQRDDLRRQAEAYAAQQQQQRQQQAEEDEAKRAYYEAHKSKGVLRDILYARYEQYGNKPLSEWERAFVDNMLEWKGDYMPAQEQKIKEVLAKYDAWEKRNGEEAAFWKA